MVAQTVLDLSSTVSVPGGNPAIVVIAPLTRPSAADNSEAKSARVVKPVGVVSYAVYASIGTMLRDSPHTTMDFG